MANNKSHTKAGEIIETPKNTDVVAYDYGQFAGAGFENDDASDYSVPFLGVLQSISPIIETNSEAKAGMLYNTVTNELFDGKTGIAFIPSDTQHVFVEWTPRAAGGGFVAIHGLDSEVVKKAQAEQEFGKYKMVKGDPKSNDLIDTYYVYGIHVRPNGTTEQLIVGFTNTKIKIYKHWKTKAKTIQIPQANGTRITAPLFSHRYRISSVAQKNNKGSFYNFVISYDGKDAEACRLKPNDPLFLEAVAFRDFAKSGKVKAAHETQMQETEVETVETPFK